jgi:hypothetical protein
MSWQDILKNKKPPKIDMKDFRHRWKKWTDSYLSRPSKPQITSLEEQRKKEKIRESYNVPKNYNKIQIIVQMLKHQNKEINRVNILEEMEEEVPTVDDNEAIEYILSR